MKSRAKAPSALSTSYRAAVLAALFACLAALGPLAGSASALPQPPEGRGYELVSSIDAGGEFPRMPNFEADNKEVYNPATPDGEQIIFRYQGHPGEQVGPRSIWHFVSRRTTEGWQLDFAGAPGDLVSAEVPAGWSPNFTPILFRLYAQSEEPLDGSLHPEDLDNDHDIYARWLDGSITWASPSWFEGQGDSAYLLDVADGAWTYYQQKPASPTSPLLVGTPSGSEAISVIDEGTSAVGSAVENNDNAFLSPDGNRVVFRSRKIDGSGPSRIWVRIRDEQRSVLASGSEPGVTSTDVDARLDVYSSDGSAVLFTTPQKLTLDDQDEQRDLYRFDIDAEDTELLSAAAPGAPSDGQAESCSSTYGVSGCEVSPVGYSADGSTAYFVSPEALDTGATPGAPNLYVRRDGTSKLVGVLAIADVPADAKGGLRTVFFSKRPARVSPDGKRLLFESRAQLTPYDNAGLAEFYVYDAELDQIQCPSCASTEAFGPNEPANLRQRQGEEFNPTIPPFAESNLDIRGRNIASGGALFYFQTAERLVSDDANKAVDVYEYSFQEDTVTLISSGRGTAGSYYVDNSVDGEDVFFFSREQLVPPGQDRNGEQWKIFDARRGGGFPEVEGSVSDCLGGDCRAEVIAPSFTASGTNVVSGFGNAHLTRKRRCPKHKRKMRTRSGKVRCVKKKVNSKRRTKQNTRSTWRHSR